jgi:hypothetical protein
MNNADKNLVLLYSVLSTSREKLLRSHGSHVPCLLSPMLSCFSKDAPCHNKRFMKWADYSHRLECRSRMTLRQSTTAEGWHYGSTTHIMFWISSKWSSAMKLAWPASTLWTSRHLWEFLDLAIENKMARLRFQHASWPISVLTNLQKPLWLKFFRPGDHTMICIYIPTSPVLDQCKKSEPRS